jgi:hypothetical protein
LVLMMAERGAPAEINGDAKELQGFFQLARERIASFLTVGRE